MKIKSKILTVINSLKYYGGYIHFIIFRLITFILVFISISIAILYWAVIKLLVDIKLITSSLLKKLMCKYTTIR
jgi:hypothetical protein